MTKATCAYCHVEASPRNLLRICTLAGEPLVVHVCEGCHAGEYQIDRAAHEVSHMAGIMAATAAGDETAVDAYVGRSRVSAWAILL